jgi:hypothetical protein
MLYSPFPSYSYSERTGIFIERTGIFIVTAGVNMQQFELLDYIWLYSIHEKCRITTVTYCIKQSYSGEHN